MLYNESILLADRIDAALCQVAALVYEIYAVPVLYSTWRLSNATVEISMATEDLAAALRLLEGGEVHR